MEIKIDTIKDSKEDILKAISFLKSITGEESSEIQTFKQQEIKEDIFAPNTDIFAVAKENSRNEPDQRRKKSPEEELFGDDSVKIIPY